MRGTSFYFEGKLAQRDLDRKYVIHRQMLDKIKQRHKSTMRKSLDSSISRSLI